VESVRLVHSDMYRKKQYGRLPLVRRMVAAFYFWLVSSKDPVRPEWWCYPTQCSKGHPWAPGLITVSWLPCSECPGGRKNHDGHLRVSCGEGCGSVWYRPPHKPD
jgi:hypothetical protein